MSRYRFVVGIVSKSRVNFKQTSYQALTKRLKQRKVYLRKFAAYLSLELFRWNRCSDKMCEHWSSSFCDFAFLVLHGGDYFYWRHSEAVDDRTHSYGRAPFFLHSLWVILIGYFLFLWYEYYSEVYCVVQASLVLVTHSNGSNTEYFYHLSLARQQSFRQLTNYLRF